MAQHKNAIDLDFRPESYFEPIRPENEVPSRVKGAARRAWVCDAIESSADPEALGGIAEPALSEFEREQLGGYHPSFMGGEYLPDFESEEVEIARIHINSTTGDVVDLRTRRDGDSIRYRIVDEYEGEGDTLDQSTERSSTQQLTLGELTEFLLPAWNLREVFHWNEQNLDEALAFTHPSSAFYAQFAALAELRIHEWIGE